jgi:hypothetical protein
MAKKNNIIAAGLNGILGPATATPQAPTATAAPDAPKPERIKGNYKTVCYSIPPELAEKIRYIAYWDRKKLNAVVTEAFEMYCNAWAPAGEKPKKL